MNELTGFFTVMAALSAATQTLVEYLIKRPFATLDKKNDDEGKEKWRQFAIHLIAFVVGGGLSLIVGLEPLAQLGVQRGELFNAAAAGLLVSFGGSFFDEATGAIREFKKAKEEVRKAKEALNKDHKFAEAAADA